MAFCMSVSVSDDLQLFAEELQQYVTPVFLEKLARKLEFVKRKRKFSGSDLATICIWMSQQVASDPLVRLCSRLHAATGTLLSPEGLNKRLNAKAVLFLQHIFSLLLQQKVCEQTQISNQLFSYFGRIRILDATVFQVPNALENVYPGSGGCAQTAGIKIQLGCFCPSPRKGGIRANYTLLEVTISKKENCTFRHNLDTFYSRQQLVYKQAISTIAT